jgi:ComF family protein
MTEPAGRWNKPAFRAYRLLWTALDWLYPPTCPGCGTIGQRWCRACQATCLRLKDCSTCPVCGDISDGLCSECASNPPGFCALRSWSLYQGALREAIHALKYQKEIAMGEALANHLIETVMEAGWSIDLITSVPLGRERLTVRGYNQAALLARPLALYLQKPFLPGLLERVRETHSQVGLNLTQRQENMAGAFTARSHKAAGKNILVIDDVTTTGATLNACAFALITAGASAVYGLTLARAVKGQANLSPAAN